MSDETRSGIENLRPWTPGESGNPTGSSKRSKARAAAKRVGGLAPAMRELLEESCPEDLLAELTSEQRAAIEGSPTLARYLASKLVTSAASAGNARDLHLSMSLIGAIDARIEEPPQSTSGEMPWESVFRLLPEVVRHAVMDAIDEVDPNDLKAAELGIPGANEKAIRAFVRGVETSDLEIIRHELEARLNDS